MKGKLYLVLIIIAGFALTTQAVQAFDPGDWLKRGIIELDKRRQKLLPETEMIGRIFQPAKIITIP